MKTDQPFNVVEKYETYHLQKVALKHGTEIAKALETPVNEDYDDLCSILGPSYCKNCE